MNRREILIGSLASLMSCSSLALAQGRPGGAGMRGGSAAGNRGGFGSRSVPGGPGSFPGQSRQGESMLQRQRAAEMRVAAEQRRLEAEQRQLAAQANSRSEASRAAHPPNEHAAEEAFLAEQNAAEARPAPENRGTPSRAAEPEQLASGTR